MGELLLKKAIQIRERIDKLRAALPSRPEDVSLDERLEAYLAFNLFLLIQDPIDLAAHLAAARGLDVPGSHRELFQALRNAGLLSAATCEGMARMAALRNRIARSYGELDPVRMVREAPAGLATAAAFVVELTDVIAPP